MGLKLYCNRYAHFKDALVCSVNCPYRTRCQDFALFYDEHRGEVDALVGNYYEGRRAKEKSAPSSVAAGSRRSLPVAPLMKPVATDVVNMRELIHLGVKQEMAEATYIWIDKDSRAELLGQEEVLRRAARGTKPLTIYKVAQEMELKFQLVPRKRIERARRLAEVEQERATAHRTRRKNASPVTASPQAFDERVEETPASNIAPAAAAPRRPRRPRTLKAVS